MQSPLLILVVLVASGLCSSEVKERTVTYDCCGTHPTIDLKPDCSVSCSIDGKPFAIHQGRIKGCSTPCLKMEDALMTLDACVNSTISCYYTCHDEMDDSKIKEEVRITYLSRPCPVPPKTTSEANRVPAGSAGPPVSCWTLVVIAVLVVNQLTC